MIVGGTGLQRQRHRSVCTSLYSLLYCTFQVLPFVLVSAFRLKRNISQPPDQLCTNFYIDTHKLSQPMICKQMTILIGCFDGRYVMICLHRASLQGQRLHTEGCRWDAQKACSGSTWAGLGCWMARCVDVPFVTGIHLGLSENSVPLHPMVNDHYPY